MSSVGEARQQVAGDHEAPLVRVVARAVAGQVAEAGVRVQPGSGRTGEVVRVRSARSRPGGRRGGRRAGGTTRSRGRAGGAPRAPRPNASAVRICSTRSAGMGSPAAFAVNDASTSASHAHSSSSWLGASTKSHSVATPLNRAHCWSPPRMSCTRWPNSWKNVTHLVVLEEAAREVAEQHRLGQRPPVMPGASGKHARVVELALARVQVEVDAAEPRRRARRRTSARPRARSATSTGTYSSVEQAPGVSSTPASTRSNGKYERTTCASTS